MQSRAACLLVTCGREKCIGQNDNADQRPASSDQKCSTRLARSARTCAGAATAGARTATLPAGTGAEYRLRLHRQQALALQLLARELAGAAHRLGLFAGLLFRGLFVVAAELHLAENPL